MLKDLTMFSWIVECAVTALCKMTLLFCFVEEGDISQQVAEKLKKLGTGAAKKRVLRPQPKLDPARYDFGKWIDLCVQLAGNNYLPIPASLIFR